MIIYELIFERSALYEAEDLATCKQYKKWSVEIPTIKEIKEKNKMNAQHKDVTLKIVEVLSKNNVILSDIDTIFSLVKDVIQKTTTVCDLYKKE